jgi:RNA polymerase sigma-70 factor, ECF subfamily
MEASRAISRSHVEQGQEADHVLVQRIVKREEAALAEAYDRYANLVYAVALRVLRETTAAEEVLQDTFHRLWMVAARFDPARGSLPAWLAVAARHRAIDRLRQRDPEGDSGPDGDAGLADIRLPFDLEDEVSRNRLFERVRAALARLPQAHRTVIELAYFEGLTHTELASHMGEPLGTIKSRLRAAVISLRRELGNLDGASNPMGR